jgi:hypothetical protein
LQWEKRLGSIYHLKENNPYTGIIDNYLFKIYGNFLLIFDKFDLNIEDFLIIIKEN